MSRAELASPLDVETRELWQALRIQRLPPRVWECQVEYSR